MITPPVKPKVMFLFFNDSRLILSKPTPYFEIIFNRFASLSTFSVIRSVPTMAASAFFKKLHSSCPENSRLDSLKKEFENFF